MKQHFAVDLSLYDFAAIGKHYNACSRRGLGVSEIPKTKFLLLAYDFREILFCPILADVNIKLSLSRE